MISSENFLSVENFLSENEPLRTGFIRDGIYYRRNYKSLVRLTWRVGLIERGFIKGFMIFHVYA
jgi:hypothetical protein